MGTGTMPKTVSWMASFLEKVVFPELEGPATRTALTPPRSWMPSAISAIFLLCRASAVWMKALMRPGLLMLLMAPTEVTPRVRPQRLYSL
jgi:hypothetical protein